MFVAIGAYLVRFSASEPALMWMDVYKPIDFLSASPADIWIFFRDLMVPIPPVVALAEILSIKLLGSPILVTHYAYRVALVSSYAAAIWLAGTSIKRSVVAFLVAFLFLLITTKAHRGNPQNYDLFLPMFFLLFLLALKRACRTGSQFWMPFLAGFFLSMTELTRPFVIFLLPVLLAGALFALAHGAGQRQWLPFLMPLLLLSGGWHAHLLAAHGQLTFSNHAGFNFQKAWPQIPRATLILEPNTSPLGPEHRAKNLNTPEHGVNSRLEQQEQLRYWRTHPVDSLAFAFSRLADLLAGNSALYGNVPTSRWLGLYALAVRLLSGLMILWTGCLVADACLHPRRIARLLVNPDNLLLLFTFGCAFILAVGERGEEPRLLLSLLPLLAALPVIRPAHGDPAQVNRLQVDAQW